MDFQGKFKVFLDGGKIFSLQCLVPNLLQNVLQKILKTDYEIKKIYAQK